jgi:4-amino-4-deoxy-L-arabinose transferase-like glycosyltransferase
MGMVLRVAPLDQNRFLEDEALYAFWGLQIASGVDPLLDEEPVDKPPLHPYLLSLSSLLFSSLTPGTGAGNWRTDETAAKLPSLYASLLCITLVYALGKELFQDTRVGLVAALLQALSPFDILFATTAFTDPLLVALALAALLAAAKRRRCSAGILVALAVATKQQGLFFVPLVVVTGMLAPGDAESRNQRRLGWLGFLIAFTAVIASVVWWDSAREQRPGFLEQSYVSYGGLGVVQVDEIVSRAADWLHLAGMFWVSPLLMGALLTGLLIWIVGGRLGLWPGWSATELVLGVFVACFLLLHWLLDFQIWDRYLLGLVPLIALLAARALVGLADALSSTPWRRALMAGFGLLLLATMTRPLLRTTNSELPVGGDHGAYDGIEDLAGYLRTRAPDASVLYHHWLGYHYRFYLYDTPLRLHWYPDLDDLVRDATIYRREPRYIAFSNWRDSQEIESTLAAAGIELIPVHEARRRDGTGSFRLYELEGP